jgi:hypothetical protein
MRGWNPLFPCLNTQPSTKGGAQGVGPSQTLIFYIWPYIHEEGGVPLLLGKLNNLIELDLWGSFLTLEPFPNLGMTLGIIPPSFSMTLVTFTKFGFFYLSQLIAGFLLSWTPHGH